MKKILIVTSVMMLAIGFGAVTAFAYTAPGGGSVTPVTITATGTIAGNVTNMTAVVVDQASTDANPSTTCTFTSPVTTNVATSNRAIKVICGTNYVNSRVIVYTDNNSYFPTKKQGVDPRFTYSPTDPTVVNGLTGVDGSGMVGQSVSGYVAALVFGISNTPGTNTTAYSAWDYSGSPAVLTKATYIVDKSHFVSFIPSPDPTGLDAKPMYAPTGNTGGINPITYNNDASLSSATNLNLATTDGLYPQYWAFDLYDTPNVNPLAPGSAKVVSEALYKNIATTAFSFGPGDATNPNNYVCTVAKSSGGQVTIPMAKLPGAPGGTLDKGLYINIGGLFVGLPAQTYTTAYLNVAFVQN